MINVLSSTALLLVYFLSIAYRLQSERILPDKNSMSPKNLYFIKKVQSKKVWLSRTFCMAPTALWD